MRASASASSFFLPLEPGSHVAELRAQHRYHGQDGGHQHEVCKLNLARILLGVAVGHPAHHRAQQRYCVDVGDAPPAGVEVEDAKHQHQTQQHQQRAAKRRAGDVRKRNPHLCAQNLRQRECRVGKTFVKAAAQTGVDHDDPAHQAQLQSPHRAGVDEPVGGAIACQRHAHHIHQHRR